MAKLDVIAVTASSFYKSESFGPGNLIDGNKNFGGWITDVKAWQDAWVEFQFAKPTQPNMVEICNGFIEENIAQTRDDYYFHKRAKDITINFGGEPHTIFEIVYFTLKDSKEPQALLLNLTQPITSARITVTSIYDTAPDNAITPYDVMGLRHIEWHIE